MVVIVLIVTSVVHLTTGYALIVLLPSLDAPGAQAWLIHITLIVLTVIRLSQSVLTAMVSVAMVIMFADDAARPCSQ